jgi:hypothetical protein
MTTAPTWESILGSVGPERRAVLEEFKEQFEEMSPEVCRGVILAIIKQRDDNGHRLWLAVRRMAEDPATDMEDLRKAFVIAFKSNRKAH